MHKGSPGLTVAKMENKIGLRIVQNGDIHLKDVFVPERDRLTGVNSFQDTAKVHLPGDVYLQFSPFLFPLNFKPPSFSLF